MGSSAVSIFALGDRFLGNNSLGRGDRSLLSFRGAEYGRYCDECMQSKCQSDPGDLEAGAAPPVPRFHHDFLAPVPLSGFILVLACTAGDRASVLVSPLSEDLALRRWLDFALQAQSRCGCEAASATSRERHEHRTNDFRRGTGLEQEDVLDLVPRTHARLLGAPLSPALVE